MNSKQGFRNKLDIRLLFIAIALLGVLFILLATKHYGLGVSPDSYTYIYYAKQLMQGKRISLTVFPPFYSAVLAGISLLFRIEPLSSARFLNALLFGLTLILCGFLYKPYLKSSKAYLALAVFSIFVAIPLVPVYLMVYSEPIFIMLVVLYLFLLEKYLQNNQRLYALLLALTVALACLTRYIGVVLILSGALSIVLFGKQAKKHKLIDALLFSIISGVPLAVLFLRNYATSGAIAGTRIPSSFTYMDNLRAALLSMTKWFVPNRLLESRVLIGGFFFVLVFLIAIFYKKVWQRAKPNLTWQCSYLLLIFVYLAFLVLTSETSFLQLIDDRYLSPIFVPINLLLLFFLQEVLKPVRLKVGDMKAAILLCLLLASWLVFPIVRTQKQFISMLNQGEGFTSKLWQENKTLQYLRDDYPDCTVYSNNNYAITFYTDQIVYETPRKSKGAVELDTLDSLKEYWPKQGQACLVWFDHIEKPYFFTPEELLSFTKLDKKVQLPDGTIYFLSKVKP